MWLTHIQSVERIDVEAEDAQIWVKKVGRACSHLRNKASMQHNAGPQNLLNKHFGGKNEIINYILFTSYVTSDNPPHQYVKF